jgi:hypothetical protein
LERIPARVYQICGNATQTEETHTHVMYFFVLAWKADVPADLLKMLERAF